MIEVFFALYRQQFNSVGLPNHYNYYYSFAMVVDNDRGVNRHVDDNVPYNVRD